MKALRLPACVSPVAYLFRFRGPRDPPLFVFALAALPTGWRTRTRPGHLFSRLPRCRRVLAWTRAGSHRFPGDPSHASALLRDPGRAEETSPLAVSSMLPPGSTNRRPQQVGNIEAHTGLQHPLSTLHERRRRRPCKSRVRLAGCASTGRASNPLDRCERFQISASSSFPGLVLSQAESSQNPTLSSVE